MANKIEDAFILNTATGTIVAADKDRSRWTLADQLNYKQTKRVSVAIKRFTYTNWFENIFSTGAANVGYLNKIYYSNDAMDLTKYCLTIPQGSYTVHTLSLIISELLREAGHTNYFTLNGGMNDNKCYFTFNANGIYVYIKEDGPYELLGFNEYDFIPADSFSSIGEIVRAPNTASFNYIESIKVRSNISWGIIDSVNKSNLLAEIVPTTTVGSIHNFEPINLTWSDSAALKNGISNIEIWLEDEIGDALPMSENWTIELLIRAYL